MFHKIPFSRLSNWCLMVLLALFLVACGGGEEEPADTSEETAATNTAVPAPTNTPEPIPTNTAVPAPDTPAESSTGEEFTQAFSRATTMMAQNGKPTPVPLGGLGGKDDETTTPLPTNTPPPLPTAAPEGTNLVGIEIDNLASTSVCFVYIASPESETWGDDQLGNEEVIESGYYRIFEVAAGTYDVRLDDCYGKVVDVQLGLEVNDLTVLEVTDAALPKGGDASLTAVNDLETTACYIFISPSDSTEWGDDWLGTGFVLDPEYQIEFSLPEGQYDFQALDCDFETLSELYGTELTSNGFVWSFSGKEVSSTATLEIINDGDAPICYLQISLTTATEWGPDWLGEEEVISAGTSRSFELTPDTYDIRALDCDQETIKEEYGIEMTGSVTWSVP